MNGLRGYLKRERKKLGLTQREVADKLGISQNYYCDIENGNRQNEMRSNILTGLSKIFNLSVNEIIEMENYEK
ncbi:XRE family transcriptional regulator [bacterium D16-51]|nr:XRE family transcriptional regulator [bacterium D16-59]RKI54068.1 XRE family transcriptional regulator [bacterium D16-51]